VNVAQVNEHLSRGDVDVEGVLPKLEELRKAAFAFAFQFGLDQLPVKPGLLIIRGARQYGKSTWLQQQIRQTIREHGPGTAFYLNGDELRDERSLVEHVRTLAPLFRSDAAVRRLFIDEITAVADWQRALKLLIDAGELRRVLVVTTGSKAADLRHGAERLPGRKGKLPRTTYLFTPIPFAEFEKKCARAVGRRHRVAAYLIAGGSPAALAEVAATGRLATHITEMARDWIVGEFAASGRSREMLVGVMEVLHRFAGSPVGQAKLAREAGLSNNTVAAGYVDLLTDLTCVASCFPWDASRKRLIRRAPCKFHMTNLLAAVAWHPRHPRSPREFLALPATQQASLVEWLVAQELWRRAAVEGADLPEALAFWRSADHEIDFVRGDESFVEVKLGTSTPLEFAWFPRVFPRGVLTVVGGSRFRTDRIAGVDLADFLRGRDE